MPGLKTKLLSNGAVRSTLRRAGDVPINVLSATGAFDYVQGARSTKAAVLCYHGVSDDPPMLGAHRYVTARRFEAQMRYLAKKTDVVGLTDLVAASESGEFPSRRSVAITFDDGLGHLTQTALPILERYGLTATFFLATDGIDKSEPIWTDKASWIIENLPGDELSFEFQNEHIQLNLSSAADRAQSLSKVFKRGQGYTSQSLAELIFAMETAASPTARGGSFYEDSNITPLTWDEVRSIRDAGQEMGSHTRTHPIVTNCNDDSMRDELLNSRLKVESETQSECRHFAYPNGSPGDFNKASGAMLKESGYHCGLTTVYGLTCPHSDVFEIPRVGVSRKDNLAVFKSKLCGLWWNGPSA